MVKAREAEAADSPGKAAGAAPADPPPRTEDRPSRQMTPAAALARHIEWLEYALGAARSEETARAGRLDTATKKNREKRTARLGEVRDEVAELTALLQGIRDLQARARTRAGTAGTSRAKRAARPGSKAPRASAQGATSAPISSGD